MKRIGSVFAAAALVLVLYVGSEWGEAAAEAAPQDFQLNQIEATLRSIENRISRIETSALSRETYDPSVARLNQIETSLASLAGIGSDISRIETRIASVASASDQLVRIETRLTTIETNVGVILGEVCSESDDC